MVKLLHSGKTVEVKEVGSFNPKPYTREKLEVGETGYFTANIKSAEEVKMGDTITDARNPSPVLPGFKEIHPMVFSGIYPINTADYEHLKVIMGKLQVERFGVRLFQPETSVALGFGFRCGFLGLVAPGDRAGTAAPRIRHGHHRDVSERGLQSHDDGRHAEGSGQPGVHARRRRYIEKIEEPMVKAFVICPNENIGDMMALISEKRGAVDHTETLDASRVMLTSLIPLNEILIDFHDRIKSITRGFGSMDYEPADYHGERHGEAGHARQHRADGRVFLHRASHQGGGQGTHAGGKAEGSHSAPAVPGENPGGHRRKNRRLAKPSAPSART